LIIYCPDQIARDFPAYWNIHLPEFEGRYYPFPKLTFRPMSSEKEQFTIGNGRLSARRVYHGWGKTDALAFRLETSEGTFVYSGDTGDCRGIREIVKYADIFVSECTIPLREIKTQDDIYKLSKEYGHLNPYLAGEIAKNGNVKRLVLFHYIGLDSDEAIIKEVKRSGYTGEITVGKDFQTIEI
ncbi:MAG: MBL fold metallo-hydrolase, partial [Nanoarchaeota archaeon]